MSAFWKMIIEIAIRALLEWLKGEDEKKAVEVAGKAGKAVKAFQDSYTA